MKTNSSIYYLRREIALLEARMAELLRADNTEAGAELADKIASRRRELLAAEGEEIDRIRQVADPELRVILYGRDVLCKSWPAIAASLGPGHTADGCRKKYNRGV